MEKEYLNCEISLTPKCPKIDHKVMQQLLMRPNKKPLDIFDDTHINDANSLCKSCDFFISI